jgi:hypothetical protein
MNRNKRTIFLVVSILREAIVPLVAYENSFKADRYFLVRIIPVRGKPVQHPYTSERRAREAYDAAVRGC